MAWDLAKTATFAMLHFGVGFGVTYAFTGSVEIATGVALVEPAVNTVVFFFHERVWKRLGRGSAAGRPAEAAVMGCGHAL
ncbi:DUF2061 domain-containing protein [Zavarzinia compransoris]|uniref:DUF2061 domain-containing protein n=1 Tax=Zavarzinia compransoris TaxID=1264899 RepID=A0A317DW47_9PROT|nr:DUF2061 domain-containing protein [Zavarzinia compransoris]PWR18751.1 hypothetical protein DKG75_17345 [Zavarzinia compransoris]TDP48734.1 putative membrane protein [Zavarzinia compransoris]